MAGEVILVRGGEESEGQVEGLEPFAEGRFGGGLFAVVVVGGGRVVGIGDVVGGFEAWPHSLCYWFVNVFAV